MTHDAASQYSLAVQFCSVHGKFTISSRPIVKGADTQLRRPYTILGPR